MKYNVGDTIYRQGYWVDDIFKAKVIEIIDDNNIKVQYDNKDCAIVDANDVRMWTEAEFEKIKIKAG